MNRRAAIRNFVVFSAGVALIPSCMQQEKEKASVVTKKFPLTADQEKMLAELSESIIPKTTAPGAKDLVTHVFILKMVDDCFEKEEREKFVKGMGQFEELTKKKFNTTFPECTPTQKAELINAIEAKKDIPEEAAAFYSSVKRLTVQSFVTSKYFLMDVRKFEMAPGRYHGCVPVKAKA